MKMHCKCMVKARKYSIFAMVSLTLHFWLNHKYNKFPGEKKKSVSFSLNYIMINVQKVNNKK